MNYKCQKCGDEWEFIPQDYGNKKNYPKVCPLCQMPVTQMIKDVYREEGVISVIRRLTLRLTNDH